MVAGRGGGGALSEEEGGEEAGYAIACSVCSLLFAVRSLVFSSRTSQDSLDHCQTLNTPGCGAGEGSEETGGSQNTTDHSKVSSREMTVRNKYLATLKLEVHCHCSESVFVATPAQTPWTLAEG